MLKRISIVLLFGLMICPVISYGQMCNGMHHYCTKMPKFMKYNSQSQSALMVKGMTSEFSLMVYKGQDYKIWLCMDESIGPDLIFKVYEKVEREVKKEFEVKEYEEIMGECPECGGSGENDGDQCYGCEGSGTIGTGEEREIIIKKTEVVKEMQTEYLYDNSEDNYSMELEFAADQTKKLYIQITVPGEVSNSRLKKVDEEGCVGVLIGHIANSKRGF